MDLSLVFDHSFNRVVQENSGQFFNTFYRIFIAKSDDIKKAFSATDMARQKRMLKESLLHLVAFSLSREVTTPLTKIAEVHANLAIGCHLYDLWMDSLIESLAEVDEHFTNRDALAWRIMLSPGIEYMKSFMRDN
jgi:hemoglobin-like flavoprotein